VAIVGGILTLLTTVVTNFLTAQANREAEQQRALLARESAQQTLQADLIKKFVEGPRPENVRENLRFLVDSGLIPDYAVSIQNYLASHPYSAPQVGNRLEFAPAGEAVPQAVQQRLRQTIDRYRTFLQGKGFTNLEGDILVFIYSKDAPLPSELLAIMPSDEPDSFYDNNTLYIHKSLSEDLSIALREFTHFALTRAVGEGFKQTAAESALADYLPATFLNSPLIGLAFRNLGSNSGFRTLDNKKSYDAEATKGVGGWYERGIVWAGALWACRDPKQPENVDNLVLPAWRKQFPPSRCWPCWFPCPFLESVCALRSQRCFFMVYCRLSVVLPPAFRTSRDRCASLRSRWDSVRWPGFGKFICQWRPVPFSPGLRQAP